MDAYSPCPCGSGKKFKWCCIDFWENIEKSFELFYSGQPENARRQMKDLVAANPTNIEITNRYAEMLILAGEFEKADEELEKVLQNQPNSPTALYLRGVLRLEEGESEGALILLRKSAQAYHPESRENLAKIYQLISEAELSRNNILASLAALRASSRFALPENSVHEILKAAESQGSQFPKTLRSIIPFFPGTVNQNEVESQLASAGMKLENLPEVFLSILQNEPSNRSARFNLGLTQAWVGKNLESLASLEQFIQEEEDESRAELSAYLQEILKFGLGIENESDYVNHRVTAQVSNGELLEKWLKEMVSTRRLVPFSQDQNRGTITFFLLEESASGLITTGSSTKEFAKIIGYLTLIPPILMAWGNDQKKMEAIKHEWLTRLAIPLDQVRENPFVADLSSILLPAAVLPLTGKDPEKARKVNQVQIEKYFEEIWIHQARKSLAGNSPIDAAGHPLLKKKLRGIVKLYEEVLSNQDPSLYDFDRLRHKLSLSDSSALTKSVEKSISSMNAGELAALKIDSLSLSDLETAFKATLNLDAKEIALKLAAGIFSTNQLGDPVLYMQAAKYLCEKDLACNENHQMLSKVEKGSGFLQLNGQPSLAIDLKLFGLKSLIQIKDSKGIITQAKGLVESEPENEKVLVACVEGLMRANCKAEAGELAEKGLHFAKKKGNSDLAGFFQEMIQSAKK